MTASSSARTQRRAQKLAAKATAYKPGDPAKSIITITEVPGSAGGFTIGLGLHGARMEEINPGSTQPVSVVDVIALAVTHIIRSQPQDFQDSVALVNATLRNVNTKLADGASVEEALGGADAALAGAISDIDPPEAANVG
jgi:hypothetical protein